MKKLRDNHIYHGDSLKVVKKFPKESVNCIVTSPPYWALRDYGAKDQLGLEVTIKEYIDKLCNILEACKDALREDGTCWVNIGDTYMGNSSYSEKGRQGFEEKTGNMSNLVKATDKEKYGTDETRLKCFGSSELPNKCLCQIPFRFSIEMCNRGWILRNTIIWHKPNCMPASATDRFTVDFEYVFFFVKSKTYWFERQLEEYSSPMNRWGGEKLKADGDSIWDKGTGQETYRKRSLRPNPKGRNKRCVWQVDTKPYPEAHFATYPEKLIFPMIKAGCPKGGIVLDPFMGGGTTALSAIKLNRKYVGVEINKEYIELAERRVKSEKEQSRLF